MYVSMRTQVLWGIENKNGLAHFFCEIELVVVVVYFSKMY